MEQLRHASACSAFLLASVLNAQGLEPLPALSGALERGGGGYCTPNFTVGVTDGDYIQEVDFADIVSNTGDNGGAAYTNYVNAGPLTRTTRVLNTGVLYLFSVTAGSYDPAGTNNESFAAWLDTDQDGSFEPDELVDSWTTTQPFEIHSINTSIDFAARIGYTRLRVMTVFNGGALDPCGSYSYGECEDYMVLIEDGARCIPLIPYGTSDGDEITNVALGGVALSGTLSEFPWINGDWIGRQLVMGATYDLDITIGAYAPEYVGAWIDWDGDGDFDDAGESLGLVQLAGAFQTATFQVTPPFLRSGYCRMRIRSAYNAPGMTACADVDYGETEDYTVSVQAPGMPCLPILGYGGTNGSGIYSANLFGVDFSGDQSAVWPHHTLHNDPPLRALQGQFYIGSLVTNANPGDRFDLRLDLNGDGDMDDAGELLWTADNTMAYETLPLSFTIPASCPPGQHLLRLRAFDIVWSPITSCQNLYLGEVEDFLVTVEENGGYCLPYLSYWTTDGDFIDGFQLGDIANTPTGGSFGPAYSDYRNLSTELERGSATNAYVIAGEYWPDAYAVYIDYNQDGTLDESTELIGSGSSTEGFDWLTFPFTVPMSALLGPTLLRVRCSYGLAGVGPCDDASFGETEDYTVVITTTTGLGDAAAHDWRVIADPLADAARIEGASLDGARYELLDAAGRTVREGRIAATPHRIGMAGLADGAYTIRLTQATGTTAKRFGWAR